MMGQPAYSTAWKWQDQTEN